MVFFRKMPNILRKGEQRPCQQGEAQQQLNNPDFIKQVADQIRSGKSEEEVAGFLRRTYKLPVLTGQLIYRQVKAKL